MTKECHIDRISVESRLNVVQATIEFSLTRAKKGQQ
jgi:hypothetical protein